jgi:hypothetical protein
MVRGAGYLNTDTTSGEAAAGGSARGLPDTQAGADLLQGHVDRLVVTLGRDVEGACQGR